MPARTFGGLSPFDFEALMRDILWEYLEVRVESFTQGRDGGIDLRARATRRSPQILPPGFLLGKHRAQRGEDPDGVIIVQCKHYESSGFSKLKSKVIEERAKVDLLKPDRYILATTVGLTPGRKSELFAEVRPWCKSEDDIWGADDIEGFLARYPEIEKNNFKLWLNSVGVLDRVLHNDVITRTAGYREDLERSARIFVQSNSYSEARKILRERHVCIISGSPGVGKTTLANILVMRIVEEGFEPVFISSEAGEADRLYRPSGKQVFVYDDFLGRTSGSEKLTKNEDDKILRLMTRVQRDSSKRFILTTREYILQQARQVYERLDDARVDLAHYILDVAAYTKMVRAQILYNHIYFSSLSAEAKMGIVESKVYLKIIDHLNYNPRLIEDAVDLASIGDVAASDLPKFLIEAFDNPRKLWAHVFKNQLGESQRAILALLLSLDPPVPLNDLERAYQSAAGSFGISESFELALRGIEATAVQISGALTTQQVDFSNPGVQDAVIDALADGGWNLSALIEGSTWFTQPLMLWNYSREPLRQQSDILSTWEIRRRTAYRRLLGSLKLDVIDPELAFPRLRKKVMGEGPRLVQCMLRTVKLELNRSRSAEWRVRAVLAAATDLSVDISDKEMTELFGWLSNRWAQGFGDKDDANLLFRFIEATKMPSLVSSRPMVAMAGSQWMAATRRRSSDYSALASFIEIMDNGAFETSLDDDDREQFNDDCLEMLRQEVDELRYGESSDEAFEALDELESVANQYGFSTGFIDDARQTLEQDADPQPDFPDDYNRDALDFSGRTSDEEAIIDGMFGTLKE